MDRPDDAAPNRDRQLALLVQSIGDYAIIMLDPGGHVVSWNAGAERIKGYTAEQIVGRHFSTFYTAEDRDRDHPAHELEIAIREGRYEEDGWRVRRDGTRFWASVTITAVRNDQGVLVGFAKVTRDLSARREAEEALREAHDQLRRSNEELDRFAVVAAHDLSEPLNTVRGFAALLAERGDLPGPSGDWIAHMASSAERMQRLIDSLLAYARAGQAPRPARAVDVRAVLDGVVADLDASMRERGAEVTIALDQAPAVLADPADVEMLLRNLLGNAVKFGDPDGPRVEVSAEAVDDLWRIDVRDNGPGIDGHDQARIFRAFERARATDAVGGTGLGLAICERIARRSGGEIGVESAPGRGSRFWVTLPRSAPATDEFPAPERSLST